MWICVQYVNWDRFNAMNLKQLENIKREKGDVSGSHHKCRNPVVCTHGPETPAVER